jgi:NAD(P)H-flavin reductase
MCGMPNSVSKYIVKVREHELLVGKYQYVDFELIKPPRIQFLAGQYLMLRVPGLEQLKSYSIASAPVQSHSVEILVDVSPGGEGSLFLASLSPGDEVEFLGPAGQFVLADPSSEIGKAEEKLLFVASGSGISAIRSMVIDLLQTKQEKREMYLHWGLRHVEDLFWEEDFRELTEFFPNFHFDVVLSQPPADWPFCSGHVTECVTTHYDNFSNMGIYLCGNGKMIQDMQEIAKQRGVGKEHVHNEKFYG